MRDYVAEVAVAPRVAELPVEGISLIITYKLLDLQRTHGILSFTSGLLYDILMN